MPCRILIQATTTDKKRKGRIKIARDEPAVWGKKEVPPDYAYLRITDADAAEMKEFSGPWLKTFQRGDVKNPDDSRRVTIEINSKITDEFGDSKGLDPVMQTYLKAEWAATDVSYDARTGVFDMPEKTDMVVLDADLIDKFLMKLGSRYLLPEADVDTALLDSDGVLELTKAQFLSKVIDRTA